MARNAVDTASTQPSPFFSFFKSLTPSQVKTVNSVYESIADVSAIDVHFVPRDVPHVPLNCKIGECDAYSVPDGKLEVNLLPSYFHIHDLNWEAGLLLHELGHELRPDILGGKVETRQFEAAKALSSSQAVLNAQSYQFQALLDWGVDLQKL